MPQSLSLRFLSGPRAGQAISVPAAGLLIGRKPGNDLVLDDPSVSGRHALVRPEGSGLSVEDLGSTNGTRIDGQRIERASLMPGQRLRFGSVEFELSSDAAAGQVGVPAQAPSAPAAPRPAPSAPSVSSGGDVGGLFLEEEIVLAGSAPELPARSLPAMLPADPAPAPALPTGGPTAPEVRKPRPASPAPAAPAPSAPAARSPRAPAAAMPAEADAAPIKQLDLSRLKSGRGPALAGAALLVGLLATAAWIVVSNREGGASERPSAGPEEVPGNLLGADWSFELPEAQSAYSEDETAPLRFSRGRAFSLSGRTGLGLDPVLPNAVGATPGDVLWAGLSTATVDVLPGRWVEASIQMGASSGGSAGLFLRFEASRADRAPCELGVWQASGPEAQRLSLCLPVLAGYDRVSARLMGRPPEVQPERTDAEGEVLAQGLALDDFVLRLAESGSSQALGDFALITGGTVSRGEAPPAPLGRLLVLARQDRPLAQMSLLERATGPADSLPFTLEMGSEAQAAGRTRIRTDAAQVLEIWLEPLLLERTERALATVLGSAALATDPAAPGNPMDLVQAYQAHGDQFEREGVQQLLIGRDLDLIRLGFAAPVRVSARPEGERVRLLVSAQGALPEIELQLTFSEQKSAAAVEAAAARRAQSAGRLGEVWVRYARLLESAPFERSLVTEAETALGSLSSSGLAELAAIEAQVERAAFFGLDGMYAECLDKLNAVAEKHQAFEGQLGPVASAAEALKGRIQAERQELARPREAAAHLSAPALRAGLRAGPGAPLAEILERLARANAPR